MEPENWSETDPIGNYDRLTILLDVALNNAAKATNLHEAKGFLIEMQSCFKGLKLLREHRETLYSRLQEAFAAVNRKIEEEKMEFEYDALSSYADLKPEVSEALRRVSESDDLKEVWESLLRIQDRMKTARLLRENRNELQSILQQAFEAVKLRRDNERNVWEQEAQSNYQRLKTLVDQGLRQAEESHEYKETREFLKKIQSEFKGTKMVPEKRGELYSRLQAAFDLLGKRLDDFFRNKKKNWEVKMKFTLSRLSADIFELETSLKKDEDYLKDLEDQLDIIVFAGKEHEALAGLQARISSVRLSMEQKLNKIAGLENDKRELENRIEDPQN